MNCPNLPSDIYRHGNDTWVRRLFDRTPDQQRGVCREPETQPIVEPFDCSREREVPFLDEIEHWDFAMSVLASDPDNQT
jgi:hypothetical protein